MKSVFYALLGLSLAMMGTAVPATAQSVTLDGDSLRRVENRSINDDYLYFYTGGEAVEANATLPNEASPASIPTSGIDEGAEVSVFGEDLNIVFGSLVERPDYVQLTNTAATNQKETQQVQLLFPLDD